MYFIKQLFMLSVILLAQTASADAWTSQQDIEQAVKKFVAQQNVPLDNPTVRITSFNNKLQVRKCGLPLKVDMPSGSRLSGRTNFSISCKQPANWKINVAAHIDGTMKVLVANQPIARGDALNQNNTDKEFRRYSQLRHGSFISLQQVSGMEASRNIRIGQVLNPGIVKAKKLVERGQHITIIATRGNLNLRLKGKAMMDGRKGQTIKVTNLSSKKLLFARVIGPGLVQVNI